MVSVYFTANAWLFCCLLFSYVYPIAESKYYSICGGFSHSIIDLYPSSGVIFVGSAEYENITSYKPNLSCQRLIRVPPGWSVAAKAKYEILEDGKDVLRAFDGGYEAKHVNEITPFNFKTEVIHTTGRLFLLSFTSDARNELKGFLLEIWANYTSSPNCKCQVIQNGETKCEFVGNSYNGKRFKSCQIKCPTGTTFNTRSEIFLNHLKEEETVRCNINNGQWLMRNYVGGYDPTTLLDTPVQCQNYSIPTKVRNKFSLSYANSNCSIINSSLGEIRALVIEIINSTNLRKHGVCFSEDKNRICSLNPLFLSCHDNSTRNEATVTIQIQDQMAKTVNLSEFDFMNTIWNDFIGVSLKIKNNFGSGKFSVKNVNATGLNHDDLRGLCATPRIFINTPTYYGICTVCPPGYRYKHDQCKFHTCAHMCVKCDKNLACFAGPPAGSYGDCNMKCPVGKGYNNTIGFCDWCPYDTYQNDSKTTRASCVKCPPNRSKTFYAGAANETDCIKPCGEGQYLAIKKSDPPECKPCPINTYSDIVYPHVERECKTCPSIKPITQGNGSAIIDDCVEKCPPGNFYNVSAKQCQECKKNTYQNKEGQFVCKDCPAGDVTVGVGQVGIQFCFSPCPEGTFVSLSNNPIRCENCPVGTFQNESNHANIKCKPCDEHKTTNGTGAVDSTECFWKCIEGQFFNLTSYRCEKCPQGTYQNERAQENCKTCPIGKITLHLGSNSVDDCVPTCVKGKYMDHGNQGLCLDCPVGTYQDKVNNSAGKDSCLKCPDLKTTTATTGTDNVTKCIPYCKVTTRCKNGGTCANKNDGYNCTCANHLEGKHCEVIKDASKAENVTFDLTFTGLTWNEDLRNSNSLKFRETAEAVGNAIRSEMKNDETFRAVHVNSFAKGSVVTNFVVTYVPDNSSKVSVETLPKAVEKGKVGELAVANDSLVVASYTCQRPLGMEDGRILNSWITASSSRDGERPWNGRLSNRPDVAWCNVPGTPKPAYLQIDFHRLVVITGIATQGRTGDRFVKSYKLAFATNLTFWKIYKDVSGYEKVFDGNVDFNSVVTNELPYRVSGRYLRFFPQDYTARQLCMRVEVYGCTMPQGSTPAVYPTLPSVISTHQPSGIPTTQRAYGTGVTSMPQGSTPAVYPTLPSVISTHQPSGKPTTQTTSEVSKTTSTSIPGEKDDKTGLIVGLVLGIFIFLLVFAFIVYCCYRKKIACVGPGPDKANNAVRLQRISLKKDKAKDDDFQAVLEENLTA